jgi:tRNA-2-methylthio-N6-dimethylallyladenosine synthase
MEHIPDNVARKRGTAEVQSRDARKVFIKTYGCQMNVYDSQRMADQLTAEGYAGTEVLEDADLVLINTCHIREKAAEKVYSELGRIREIKKARNAEGRDLVLGVTGCVAQAEGKEILRRERAVDMVIGPQNYHRLPSILRRVENGERVIDHDHAVEDKFEHLANPDKKAVMKRGVTAFVTIQEGCDKFCSFCVVPYTRGAEISRPVTQILTEVERLASMGVREITLLGQNVNAWHGEALDGSTWSFARLLNRLSQISGISRLRYMTSHPRDMDDDLIAAHRDNPAIMPFLHLPVQSGSDRVLKAMNRRHTAQDYLRLIDRIKAASPDIALSSDFIVGHPGESDADFEATLAMVSQVGFAQTYSFKYSPRPGTPAAEDVNQVPENVKDQRLAQLQSLLGKQQQDFVQGFVDKSMSVLIEKVGRKPGQVIAKSPWLLPVILDENAGEIGDIVDVRITRTAQNSLFGTRLVTA